MQAGGGTGAASAFASTSKVRCVGLKRHNAILLMLITNADSFRGGGGGLRRSLGGGGQLSDPHAITLQQSWMHRNPLHAFMLHYCCNPLLSVAGSTFSVWEGGRPLPQTCCLVIPDQRPDAGYRWDEVTVCHCDCSGVVPFHLSPFMWTAEG